STFWSRSSGPPVEIAATASTGSMTAPPRAPDNPIGETMATTLGSILLGTADPERLRRWYVDAFDAKVNQHGCLELADTPGILIDGRSDVQSANPEPGRVILNFHVEDARATAAHLTEMGVSWLVAVEERANGRFGTLLDPDGNYVQIIELNAEYLASLS